jgi:hypothetical protein
MESIVEWQANATRDEIIMGDQDDIPIDLCEELDSMEERVMAESHRIQKFNLELDDANEMQQGRLHERSQPMDQLDRVMEHIIRLMLNLA